jgi:hypothetical protein
MIIRDIRYRKRIDYYETVKMAKRWPGDPDLADYFPGKG